MNKRYEIDNLLLNEARNGNERAFVKLFSFYYKIILVNILKIVNNQEDAEDLTMITFEKAFTKLDKYAPTSGFGSWLNEVARNTALDFLMYKKRRPWNFVEMEETYCNNIHVVTPEESYIGKELEKNLDKAIDQLPNNFKKIFNLRYIENMPFKEISLKLNVKLYTALGSMRYAREKLKKILSEY